MFVFSETMFLSIIIYSRLR